MNNEHVIAYKLDRLRRWSWLLLNGEKGRIPVLTVVNEAKDVISAWSMLVLEVQLAGRDYSSRMLDGGDVWQSQTIGLSSSHI